MFEWKEVETVFVILYEVWRLILLHPKLKLSLKLNVPKLLMALPTDILVEESL